MMVTTMQQAQRIQVNRKDDNKRGYAKAVRRYLLRVHKGNYSGEKARLPVLW